jgi:hypothetical protein
MLVPYIEYTVADFLESKCELAEKVHAIDAMITSALSLMAANLAGQGGNISYYELNDGQIHVKTGYRSIVEIEQGIMALRRLRNAYRSELRGRASVLVDKKTFYGNGGWGCR